MCHGCGRDVAGQLFLLTAGMITFGLRPAPASDGPEPVQAMLEVELGREVGRELLESGVEFLIHQFFPHYRIRLDQATAEGV